MNKKQLNQLLGEDICKIIDMPNDDIEQEEFAGELMEVFFGRLMQAVEGELKVKDADKLHAMFADNADIQSILEFANSKCANFSEITRLELAQFRADLVNLSA